MRKGKRGSALVMVIWTITILSLLVISFAMEAKLQSYVNVFMRERVRLENLVENGTVLAEVIVVGAPDVSAETEDEDLEELLELDRWLLEKRELKRNGKVTIGPIAVDSENPEGGTVTIEIMAKGSGGAQSGGDGKSSSGGSNGGGPKFNINLLYPEGNPKWDILWKSILTWANVPEDDHDKFVDSWLDWHDADESQTGEYGAEAEYYEDEIEWKDDEKPYKPRNGDIPDIRELAKLRGFRDHPALLGIPNEKGLYTYDPEDTNDKDPLCVSNILEVLDVFGGLTIDVRHASKAVLMCIPGIQDTAASTYDYEETSDIAQAIVDYRDALESGVENEFTMKDSFDEPDWDWNKLLEITSDQIQPLAQEYISFESSLGEGATYDVKITGQVMGMTYKIEAIAFVKSGELKYLRWQESSQNR
jgi:hypothetical protein